MKKQILHLLAALILMLSQVEAASTTPKQEDARGLPNLSQRASGHWKVFGDALIWFASEQASSVWIDVIEIGDNTSAFVAQNLSFDWNAGFRVGAGYNFDYDQWDTQFYWTSYQTKAHQSQEVFPEFIAIPGGGVLVTQQLHPEFFAADLAGVFSESAHIHWNLVFNMFDWELGRCYWVSKGLSLRPFIGLKGGWIDQSIHVKYGDLIINSTPTEINANEHVKNNFWGIGPVLGVNTQWKLRNFGTHYPSFFGDFSAATLWGTWECSDVYKDTTHEKVNVHTKNATLGALMFRGFVGIGWDVAFNKERMHFGTRLGYEMQLWVNQLRVATSQLVRLHGDLTLQGVTFNCGLDF
jgi:hypothetical protein